MMTKLDPACRTELAPWVVANYYRLSDDQVGRLLTLNMSTEHGGCEDKNKGN